MIIKILLVDDDYIDIETVKRYLKDEDYKIITATSGQMALDILNEDDSISLILLDARMPGLSGFETCLKINNIYNDIPVILVTGMADENSLKKAFDSGAVDYISKPVKRLEVVSRINNILKIKDAENKVKRMYSSLLSDIKLASSVQSYLLTDWIKINKNLTMTSTYMPISSVSGDLFDLIQLSDDKYLIYLGDISGHGVQASLIMAAIQMAIRLELTECEQEVSIVKIMNKLNSIFFNQFPEASYMTFLLGVIDFNKHEFKYFSAGHPPVVLYDRCSGHAATCKEKGSLPIGMFLNNEYCDNDIDSIRFEKSTALLMYTDGLFECNSEKNEKFDLESLITEISNKTFSSIYSMPDELISHIESKGFSFDDDVTVLLLLGNNNSSNDLSFSILPKLNRVREKVIEICSLMNSLIQDKDILIHIELLLTEHLSNIIVHGRMEDNKSKLERIFLSIRSENDQLILMTLDKGIEWKYSKDRIKEDEQYMESGRGLDIINTIADKVSYKRINNLNESTFTLKIR